MGYTKRQFIEAACEEIGLANYVFDMQPEQLQAALRRLDAMMAEWNAQKIRVGYPVPKSPEDSSLSEETGVPDSAWQAIVSNLALRLAPTYGKTPMPETKEAAATGFQTLLDLAQYQQGAAVTNTGPYTKRNFVEAALGELGLTPFIANMDEATLAEDARRLDRMMAEWNALGIRLGYPLASRPASVNLDTEATVPDSAWEAVVANLATRIASVHRAAISQETHTIANSGYRTLLSRAAMPPERQMQVLPAGAGNKPWRTGNPFTRPPVDPLTAGDDSVLEF